MTDPEYVIRSEGKFSAKYGVGVRELTSDIRKASHLPKKLANTIAEIMSLHVDAAAYPVEWFEDGATLPVRISDLIEIMETDNPKYIARRILKEAGR